MPLDERGTKLLEHILDTGNTDAFHVLADHVEENGMPTLAKVLRGRRPHNRTLDYEPYEGFEASLGPPERGDYESRDAHRERVEDWESNGYNNPESFRHSAFKAHHEVQHRSPELIPGVHLHPHGPGYSLFDFRDPFPDEIHPDIEKMYEEGRDDEVHPVLNDMQEHYLEARPSKHYFQTGHVRDKLELAKPLPVYEEPGDEVHITGLSKGGNCEHCGKPDTYRIHVKHPISGETCKIGSSCASGLLRETGSKNLTGAMQPKKILHHAATAQALGDIPVKVRLKNKDTKLKLARGISSGQDTHSQEEIYAALVAEGVEPTKAEELSHALS